MFTYLHNSCIHSFTGKYLHVSYLSYVYASAEFSPCLLRCEHGFLSSLLGWPWSIVLTWISSPWYNHAGWLGVKHQVTCLRDYLQVILLSSKVNIYRYSLLPQRWIFTGIPSLLKGEYLQVYSVLQGWIYLHLFLPLYKDFPQRVFAS